MKRKHYMAVFLLPICMAFTGSKTYEYKLVSYIKVKPAVEFPENVNEIIQNKCYECHNPESKSIMAKGKLDWDSLTELKDSKLVRKLEGIVEVLDDGSMPPRRYLKMNPDAQLDDEEVMLLKEWIITTLKDLSK